ncbi:MAG: ribonuclease HI [Lachnospiraceae bacterium]
MTSVTVYTDGSSRGNPGPGGYGAVLEYIDGAGTLHTKEMSAGYRLTTNNRMELMGVISALRALNRPCAVQLYTDSRYIVDAVNLHWLDGWARRGWKRGKNEKVRNVDLWKQIRELTGIHQVTFNWVKGHNGHPQNERCDQLATAAADGDHLLEDTGYEPE